MKVRPLRERLYERISPCPNTGCWWFIGAHSSNGYPAIGTGGRNKSAPAHRVMYELEKGELGDKFVCHTCDNPGCVNPDHLFLGTHQENMDDMKLKGRSPKYVGRLTEDQVHEIRNGSDSGAYYARKYEVSESMICRIRKGNRY